MKNSFKTFVELPIKRKIAVIVAGMLTIAFCVAVPVYAWFSNQRRAAEMFKVEYPNSLYINAAHREDQKYFELDGININDYAKDPITGNKLIDEYENPIFVSKFSYVFSVSGSSTNVFTLQMAHTNNNLFTYKIYEAAQYDNAIDAENAASNDTTKIVKYTQHSNNRTENRIQVVGDEFVDGATSDLYYVKGNALDGEYKNPKQKDAADNGEGNAGGAANVDEERIRLAEKNVEDPFYFKTYGTNTNVNEYSVPLYWQSDVNVTTDVNKNFCKYYILEVTWDGEEQDKQTSKETDLVYFSVKLVS